MPNISSSIWMECSAWPWFINFTSRLKWLPVRPVPQIHGPLLTKDLPPLTILLIDVNIDNLTDFFNSLYYFILLVPFRVTERSNFWKKNEFPRTDCKTSGFSIEIIDQVLIFSSTKLVKVVIFWYLVNKRSQSLTTTKTNDCEISFRAIRSSPAKTHCIHMHEIACANTCYESWVMQWIIPTACNNATVSSIRLGTVVKLKPGGNMLVNCHVWIIKHYTWTLKVAYFRELQAPECSFWTHHFFWCFPVVCFHWRSYVSNWTLQLLTVIRKWLFTRENIFRTAIFVKIFMYAYRYYQKNVIRVTEPLHFRLVFVFCRRIYPRQ